MERTVEVSPPLPQVAAERVEMIGHRQICFEHIDVGSQRRRGASSVLDVAFEAGQHDLGARLQRCGGCCVGDRLGVHDAGDQQVLAGEELSWR